MFVFVLFPPPPDNRTVQSTLRAFPVPETAITLAHIPPSLVQKPPQPKPPKPASKKPLPPKVTAPPLTNIPTVLPSTQPQYPYSQPDSIYSYPSQEGSFDPVFLAPEPEMEMVSSQASTKDVGGVFWKCFFRSYQSVSFWFPLTSLTVNLVIKF